MLRRLAPLLLLFLGSTMVVAGEETPEATRPASAAEAARRVAQAIEADDQSALRELAGRVDPDPWLIADVLRERGRQEMAVRFAGAGKGPVLTPLSAWLAAHPPGREDEARRLRLASASKLRATDAQAALAELGEPQSSVGDLIAVRTALLRAELLQALRRREAAAETFERIAEATEAMGWRVRASETLLQAARLRAHESNYKLALVLYQRRLTLEQALDDKVGIGRAHFAVSTTLGTLGRIDGETRHRETAARIAEAHGDAEYLAKAISNTAVAKAQAGDTEGAIADFERAGAVLETLDADRLASRFQPEPARIAQSRSRLLGNCASLSLSLGDETRARQYARQAVAAARAGEDADVLDEATAFLAVMRGAGHEHDGRYMEALAQYELARGRYRRLGRRAQQAGALRRIAGARNCLGDLPAAIRAVEAAIGILRETGANRRLCRAHNEAGRICLSLGRTSEGEVHLREALRLARLLRGVQLEAEILGDIARLHRKRAEYARALDALHEALRLHEAHPGRTSPATTLLELSRLHGAIGNSKRSLAYVDRAVASLDARSGARIRSRVRSQKALLLGGEERYEEALALLKGTLSEYESRGDRSGAARTLCQMSGILLNQNDRAAWGRVRSLQEKAVGLQVAAGNKHGEMEARMLLARAQVWTGERDRGLEEATYAHELAEEMADVQYVAWSLATLAQVHYLRDEFKLARQRAGEGAALVGSYGLDLAEGEQAIVRSSFASLYQWGAAAALREKNDPALFAFLERSRASALVAALGGRAALREARVPTSLRAAEEEANAAAAMAYRRYEQARRNGNLKQIRAHDKELEAARARQQEAVAAIQRAVRSQADLTYVKPVALPDLQKILAPGDALVVYGTTGWRYLAQVVSRDAVRTVVLGPHRGVTDAVKALTGGTINDENVAAVRALVLDPLGLGEETKRLLVAPMGALIDLPFGLLESERPVSLVPSATAYAMLRAMRVEAGEKVLALGDPSYIGRPPSRPGGAQVARGGGFAPLPGSRDEAKSIGDVVLLGTQASETRFREVMRSTKRWRAVHLACHGLVDATLPSRSALVLAHDAHNDGFLYAGELFAEVPVPADLVVLSGCETALGRVYHGEGLVGLSRAFMLAGTPRVLASLWKVDDAATQALMKHFYALWRPRDGTQGLAAAEALRKAQDHVRRDERWAAPEYWAAWILWGLPD